MRELDSLIDKLNTDQYAAVSVFDLETNSYLYRNISHSEIVHKHQTAEDFFEFLFAKGHKALELTPKRKNGSSYKVTGVSFKVNFSSNTPQMEIAPPAPQPIAPAPAMMPALNPNHLGLGTLDIMNLMVSKNDATRLFTENEFLKKENQEQKKLIEELKEERLKTKYDSDKSSANQSMLLGALQHLPTLAGMFNGSAGAAATAGLAGAVEQFTTPAKKTFATALQQIDDTVVSVLYNINTGLNSNNEFSIELAELLKKHNLWQS